ncbi:MAG: DEAD/DEAH box helicase [Anaerolineae bacterium]|nr:DEAD/DEAH box helicase [Anaerolineae bacterium]
MTDTFLELGLHPTLLDTLTELGYVNPTPIQAAAIPALLDGRDVLGQAQTGTGKTAAFTLPVLHHLDPEGLQTLILTPTRELAIQVSESVHRYGKRLGVKVLPVYGGQSYERQQRRLRKGVQVVVGTPGRTLDLIRKGVMDVSKVRFMILDEADEMFKMGFIDDIETILGATPADTRQTLLFSATFSPAVRKVTKKHMRNPLDVSIENEEVTGDNIALRYFMVRDRDKVTALCRVLEVETIQNTLIFTRTKIGAAKLAETLLERGFPASAIHGDLAQNERERILGRFRDGHLTILVATDVMGRGVDIPEVSHVINYDIPQLPIEYVHRIGRTGRAGRNGEAITFVTSRERHTLRRIEQYIERRITKAQLPSRDDVLKSRNAQFEQALIKQIESGLDDNYADVIDSLVEKGYSPDQVIVAAVQMLREREFQYPLEEIRAVSEKSSRYDRKQRGSYNDRKSSNGGRDRNRKGRGGKRHNDENMVRLRMDVGRTSGVKPGDVIYSVASTANIPGRVIGAIDIQKEITYIDVPIDHVDSVLRRMKRGGKLRGQNVTLTRA